MKLTEGMKNITENIIACHNVRVKALGDLFDEVNETLTKFTTDRKKMSAEQAAELARFVHEVASDIGKKLKGFRHELEIISKDRVLTAKELRGRLQKEAKELASMVKKNLGDYRKDHTEMSAAMKKDLESFVKGIVGAVGDMTASTKGMMKHYRDDVYKASAAWKSMTHTLAKARGEIAGAAGVEGEQSFDTVEGAVRKIKRRRKKKK